MAKKGTLSRPKNDSYEAFKAWMLETFDRMTGKKSDGTVSEDRIRESHKKWLAAKNNK